jgi:hypothetical protein
LFTHLRLGFPSLFSSGFPTNILDAFLSPPNSCYIPCPSHPTRLQVTDQLSSYSSTCLEWLRNVRTVCYNS